jgi:hypothetical protein
MKQACCLASADIDYTIGAAAAIPRVNEIVINSQELSLEVRSSFHQLQIDEL